MSQCAFKSETRNKTACRGKNKAKAKKTTDIKEIWAELWDTMGGRHRHVIDDDYVYTYLTYMHLDKWHAYRVTIRASKAKE